MFYCCTCQSEAACKRFCRTWKAEILWSHLWALTILGGKRPVEEGKLYLSCRPALMFDLAPEPPAIEVEHLALLAQVLLLWQRGELKVFQEDGIFLLTWQHSLTRTTHGLFELFPRHVFASGLVNACQVCWTLQKWLKALWGNHFISTKAWTVVVLHLEVRRDAMKVTFHTSEYYYFGRSERRESALSALLSPIVPLGNLMTTLVKSGLLFCCQADILFLNKPLFLWKCEKESCVAHKLYFF